MRTPRVIATRCRLCSEPIEDTIREVRYYNGQSDNYSRDGWCLLLNGEPVHTRCANEATKEREFKEEAPGLVPGR